jgi:hypothetical protein
MVRHTKTTHNSLDEFDSSMGSEGPDWFNLYPLRKLVDGDQ